MRAAEHATVLFDAVANDAAVAMLASRGHGMDRALERIERAATIALDDVEGVAVVVSAYITGFHGTLLVPPWW